MYKQRHIDFIIFEDEDEKIIFRFYPRQSSCHSFGANPPKDWNDVYKVYYHYRIFKLWKDDGFSEELFDSYCDECSEIGEVSCYIKYLMEGKKSITINHDGTDYKIKFLDNEILPCGDGVSWVIHHCRREWYEIFLWNASDIGYRFRLTKTKMKEFGEYLNSCCEYMLSHGNPI